MPLFLSSFWVQPPTTVMVCSHILGTDTQFWSHQNERHCALEQHNLVNTHWSLINQLYTQWPLDPVHLHPVPQTSHPVTQTPKLCSTLGLQYTRSPTFPWGHSGAGYSSAFLLIPHPDPGETSCEFSQQRAQPFNPSTWLPRKISSIYMNPVPVLRMGETLQRTKSAPLCQWLLWTGSSMPVHPTGGSSMYKGQPIFTVCSIVKVYSGYQSRPTTMVPIPKNHTQIFSPQMLNAKGIGSM